MKLIQKFLINHLKVIEKRGIKNNFVKYIEMHTKIAAENMAKKAKDIIVERQNMALDSAAGGGPGGGDGGKGGPQQKKPGSAGKHNTAHPAQVRKPVPAH